MKSVKWRCYSAEFDKISSNKTQIINELIHFQLTQHVDAEAYLIYAQNVLGRLRDVRCPMPEPAQIHFIAAGLPVEYDVFKMTHLSVEAKARSKRP